MNKKRIAGLITAAAILCAGAVSVSAGAATVTTAKAATTTTATATQKTGVIVRPDENSYYKSEDGGATWKKTTDGGKTWTTAKASDVPAAKGRDADKSPRDDGKTGVAPPKIASSTTIYEDGTGIKIVGETVTYTTDSGKTWTATKPANFPERGEMFGGGFSARGGGRGFDAPAATAAKGTTSTATGGTAT